MLFCSISLFYNINVPRKACCCCLVTKSCPTLGTPVDRSLPRPLCLWDFPGQNIGVGCHFLLQGIVWPRDWTHISCLAGGFFTIEPQGKPCRKSAAAATAAAAKSLQLCPTLCDPYRLQPTRLLRPWDSPGKNTGVGCHCLLCVGSLLIYYYKTCTKCLPIFTTPSFYFKEREKSKKVS